jgi:hypothetical protein
MEECKSCQHAFEAVQRRSEITIVRAQDQLIRWDSTGLNIPLVISTKEIKDIKTNKG